MSASIALLAQQESSANTRVRLRAGRLRSAGIEHGSLDEIVAGKVHKLTTPDTGKNTFGAINTLGLTPEEVESIGNDIQAVLPLGSLAMAKLFSTLGFSDVSKNEKNGKLILGVNEYEIVRAKANIGPNTGNEVPVIRMPNHVIESEKTDMANKAIDAIRSLFPGKTIHFTLEALNTSADTHGIYPGYRYGVNGKPVDSGRTVYSWSGGSGDAVFAPYAGRDRVGDSYSDGGNRQNAGCLVASFG